MEYILRQYQKDSSEKKLKFGGSSNVLGEMNLKLNGYFSLSSFLIVYPNQIVNNFVENHKDQTVHRQL